jgi:hypothetical protein
LAFASNLSLDGIHYNVIFSIIRTITVGFGITPNLLTLLHQLEDNSSTWSNLPIQ